MAETDDRKVLKMSLVCSICLQQLNKPRSLPCFHTFCESCLKNYLVNAPEKPDATKSGIPCPTCRLATFSPKPTLPVDKWAENFPVNHLVGTLIDIVPMTARLEFCEPCKDNKVSKIAMSWCQECQEALCEECAKCHMSMKATKNHEITPLENVRSNPKRSVREEVTCSEHTKREVDMYCKDHEQPSCAMCIAKDHRKCEKIYQIEEVMKKQEATDQARLMKQMDKLVADTDGVKKERQEVMRGTMAQKNKMLQDIAHAKKKLLDHIEKLESQITAKFNAITQTDFAIMQEQIDYCNSVQSAMYHAKSEITSAKEQQLKKREFIVTQQGQKKYEECTEGLKKIVENSAKIHYAFEEDIQISETLGALKILGKLDVKHTYPNKKPVTPPLPPTPPLPEDNEKKATKKVKTFNAKVKGDKRECRITAIKLWCNKKVLLADNANSRLKLFGEFGDLTCTFDCMNAPWDFTFIDKGKCAVTYPSERKIRIFRVKETITEVGFIQVMRGGNGICMACDDLVVTFGSGCIRVISLDGAVKMMVDTDYIGKRVFSNPEFVTFSHMTSTIFVSDYNNHNVTALKYDSGKVDKTPQFVYPVSGPRGVEVDFHGNLYVCGFWSNDIHKVREEGKFRQMLVNSLARPLCIAFNEEGEKFALSEQGNPNSVKVYRIIAASEVEDV
ncbi:transcription intermediary factor 1-beta-like [Mya arenaria]|uniref:transcription intermediary factor 1-beta-like n=1 Tax=Mya arenaria TaxID=6604 RepID=UPI0022E2D445|nr:transcription intermediary factor 1-beta-like [Mya arenaria]